MRKRSVQAATSGRFAAAWIIVLLFASTSVLARDKTDIVLLENGDRITGEIIQLEHGQLELKTDSLGTVYIEWPKVSGLSSSVVFMVEHLGGQNEFGRLGGSNGHLIIDDEGRMTDVPMSDVARLGPVQDTFLARVRGSTSVGVNYAQANSVKVSSFRFDAEYRGRNTLASLSASADCSSTIRSAFTSGTPVSGRSSVLLSAIRRWESTVDRKRELP
jgi:hypothetical protein